MTNVYAELKLPTSLSVALTLLYMVGSGKDRKSLIDEVYRLEIQGSSP